MAWECYMVEYAGQTEPELFEDGGSFSHAQWKLADGTIVQIDGLRPGAMWFDDDCGLCVLLPCKIIWHPDRSDRTWKRTGDPPNVTITPSINAVGTYHGYLTNGALTDDLEGRTF